MKEQIEMEFRVKERNDMDKYLLIREKYYRTTSGLFPGERMHIDYSDLRVAIAREAIISRDVVRRDKRRAENTLFRYYYLEKFLRKSVEGLASIPPEVAKHIGGFSTNVWPDGFAEFELANSFEDYLRKQPDFTLGEDMAIYPEEQKTNLNQFCNMVEAVTEGVVETPADER